jgi:hypothetical protein
VRVRQGGAGETDLLVCHETALSRLSPFGLRIGLPWEQQSFSGFVRPPHARAARKQKIKMYTFKIIGSVVRYTNPQIETLRKTQIKHLTM